MNMVMYFLQIDYEQFVHAMFDKAENLPELQSLVVRRLQTPATVTDNCKIILVYYNIIPPTILIAFVLVSKHQCFT